MNKRRKKCEKVTHPKFFFEKLRQHVRFQGREEVEILKIAICNLIFERFILIGNKELFKALDLEMISSDI